MAKIGVGVIGLGRMGAVYASFIASQVAGAWLVAVADMRAEIAAAFIAEYDGVTAYEDYHELLTDARVDAVVIVTPTHTHHEIVIAAAQAQKAIFCEKPMALTLHETDAMIAAVEAAGVFFQVGFMRRFDRGYLRAKQQIEDGLIGDPVTVCCIGRDPFATSLEYADPAVSGGLIVDMGIHDLDLARWLMSDEITRVYSEVSSLVYPELLTVGDVDSAMITLRFERGGLGNIDVSRIAHYGYDIRTNVIGTKGALQIGYLRETPVVLLNREGAHHDIVPHFPERFGAAYTAQIAAFIGCLQADRAPSITTHDARAALQAALAATISHREGRAVRVAEVTA